MMSWFGVIVAEAIQLSKNGSVFFACIAGDDEQSKKIGRIIW